MSLHCIDFKYLWFYFIFRENLFTCIENTLKVFHIVPPQRLDKIPMGSKRYFILFDTQYLILLFLFQNESSKILKIISCFFFFWNFHVSIFDEKKKVKIFVFEHSFMKIFVIIYLSRELFEILEIQTRNLLL